MASISIAGDTSGQVTIAAPAVAGANTITLPAATGTSQLIGTGTAVNTTGNTVSAYDFTNIPSWAKRVTVMFNGVSTNGTSGLQIQVGSGSIATSGYIGCVLNVASTAASGANTPNSNSFNVFGIINAATNLQSGAVVLSTLGGNVWTSFGNIANDTGSRVAVSGGAISLGGVLDRVRVSSTNGTDTFDAGSLNVMWEG